MNTTINFSNYSQIKTEEKLQVNNKTTNHKFIITSIFFNIIIIILIIVITNTNIKIKNKEEESSKIEKEINEIKDNFNNIEQKINSIENININLLNNLTKTKNEIGSFQSEYDTMKSKNFQLLYNKNDLIAHKDFINNKIEYIHKCLKEDDLRRELEEKNELYKKIIQRLNDLSILNSNIITNLALFKYLANVEILNKCYDSIVYGFNINRFHENCDGYPLLILIKTKANEKIGGFTSITNEGIKKIRDENSMLINFDRNEYFANNKENEECYVYSHFDEFPQFGNDLIIYRDGKGESMNNDCYKINEDKNKELMGNKKFEIEIMEIYKLKLKFLM